MNSFRFSGSLRVETCSAEITVPWITSTSRPALERGLVVDAHPLGVSEAAATTPCSLISRIRRAMSSSLIGSA